VPRSAAGSRLIDYLAARFRYQDRNRWRDSIAAGAVWVDGVVVAATHRLRAGALVAYRQAGQEPWVDAAFQILANTSDYAVLAKPAHLPMHADGPFVQNTLIALLRRGPLPDAALVHRLDRETSGVCVVARTATARTALAAQFAQSSVVKRYLAIVHGQVHADFTVDAPIGRCRTSAITVRRSAAADAVEPRPATTHCRVLAASGERSLLCCTPETGRTHQIRVHLEHAGHPLLGDKLYGRSDAEYLEFVARAKATGDARLGGGTGPQRQLLHAHWLAFLDPRTQQRVAFTAPWPEDFARWLPSS
jgi:RluA family pseudouridine synthase